MTRYRFAKVLLYLLIVCCMTITARAERLPIKTYTTADGLAHNDVNRIVRDSRGFLWFCTFEGLSRFDGYEFTNFGVDQGLPSPNVNDLLETRDGKYWVATAAGLCGFNPTGAVGRCELLIRGERAAEDQRSAAGRWHDHRPGRSPV